MTAAEKALELYPVRMGRPFGDTGMKEDLNEHDREIWLEGVQWCQSQEVDKKAAAFGEFIIENDPIAYEFYTKHILNKNS